MPDIVESNTSVTRVDESTDKSEEARKKIDYLQSQVELMPQIEIPLQHFFANGIYARQGIIKKGTILIGAIKKYSHINIITSGDISIFTEGGEVRITGATTMVSAGGTKRVGYAHEDTVWTTIIRADTTDVDKVEEEVLCKTYEDYLEYCRNTKLLEV